MLTEMECRSAYASLAHGCTDPDCCIAKGKPYPDWELKQNMEWALDGFRSTPVFYIVWILSDKSERSRI